MPFPATFTVTYEIYGVTIANVDALLSPSSYVSGSGSDFTMTIEPDTVGKLGKEIAISYSYQSTDADHVGQFNLFMISSDNAGGPNPSTVISRHLVGPVASAEVASGEVIVPAHHSWYLFVEVTSPPGQHGEVTYTVNASIVD